nr:MAG TPA: DNA pilot protein [Microviridae sp.]
MSFLSDIAGDVVGAVTGIWSANKGNSAAFEMQANSINAQRESMQNRHQWEVEDLRKAGLNPILSATNSAGGSISGATANVMAPDIAGALNKIANSALMRKQTELAEKDLQAKLDNAKANLTNADANQINAQAKMIEAHTDQLRTNSAIELNTANIGYLGAMTNYTKQKQENETAMNKMQIKEIDQRIVNSIQELAAKVVYLQKTGDAALMSASAAQRNAAAQELMAQVAQQNGISLRQLQGALTQKGLAEVGEISARINNYNAQTFKTQTEGNILYNRYPLTSGKDTNTGLRQDLFGTGELIKILSPFAGFMD